MAKTTAAKTKERINGFAAGAALLDLYECKSGTHEGEVATFDWIPIQRFVEKIIAKDKDALPSFFMVLHDYLCVLGEGCVPDPGYYVSVCCLTDADLQRVKKQLELV